MITIGYSTRKSDNKFKEHLKKSCGNHIKGLEIIEVVNPDGRSLTEVYNEIINQASNDIIVLCHDDLIFDTKSWGYKLIEHFKTSEYGILGVAGTTSIPESGMWWEDRSKMVGIVNHESNGKKWESKYCKNWSNDILETVMVDGLFIALHRKRIKEIFNTDVEGFHFYDVEFSTQNYLKDVKIGVLFNIRITHKSIGQTNEQWEVNRMLYSVRHKNSLPINYIPEIPTISKKEIFNFTIILQSTNTEKTKKFIEKVTTLNHKSNIVLLSNSSNYSELEEIKNIKLINCFYDDITKNFDLLKYENDFFGESELVFITSDLTEVVNDVFSNAYSLFKKGKNNFGSWFPTSFYQNNSIFSSSLLLTTNGENNYGFHLVNNNTQYNVLNNPQENPFGNIVNFMCTTPNNILKTEWFNSNYNNSFYFNEFSLKMFSNGKSVFVDNTSFVIDNNYVDKDLLTTIGPDFQLFLNKVQEVKKVHQFIKLIKK